MNLSQRFIEKPVMTTLVMAALVIFGGFGYSSLPVSDLPNIDFPTISVNANLPGADPDTMASSVASPLENQFSAITGIDQMTSTSTQGSTQIQLQFSLDRTVDAAAQDVQSAISAATRNLPKALPQPPTFRKQNPADIPIMFLALSSSTMKSSEVDEYAETLLARQISTIEGVAQVGVFGSAKYAVRIQADPAALATRQIGIDKLVTAVANANVNLATGALNGPTRSTVIHTGGQLNNAGEFNNQIVAYQNGSPVRLKDVAQVIDGMENPYGKSWYRNREAINLPIFRQPGSNVVAVTDAIKKILPQFKASLPPAVQLDVVFDRSQMIRASIDDVQHTLLIAGALVVGVIFVFLRRVSATLIPSLALPIAIIGTFAGMAAFGYSLDNLSLMALTLSVGFVVDDAIVMLENIVRHIERGEAVFEAALRGSKEIGFTILSMTISLAAVFIPILFMGGVIGRLFREFAVTIGVAILVSGIVSLSLTPMLCSRFLKPEGDKRHGALYQWSERGFDAMLNAYRRSLRSVLARPRTVLVFSAAVLAATLWLFAVIPKGFLPTEDQGLIFGFTEGAQGIGFPAMKEHQQQVAAIVRAHPDVANVLSSCGPRGNISVSNSGIVMAQLKPRSERRRTADQILAELQPRLARVPGIRVFLQIPPPIRLGGTLTKSQYQYTLQDSDTGELYRFAPQLEQRMRGVPLLQDVTSDLQLANPQLNVSIDRDRAAALGISPQKIEDALYTAY